MVGAPGIEALDVYEEALGSQDAHLAAATATRLLEGSGVMDKRGLQGTIDDAVARNTIHQTSMPDEFHPWFNSRKPRRVTVKTELQVVPQLLIEAGSVTDTPLDPVTPKRSPGPEDTESMPLLFDDETDGKA